MPTKKQEPDLVASSVRQTLLFEEHDPSGKDFVNAVEEAASRYGGGGAFWGGQELVNNGG